MSSHAIVVGSGLAGLTATLQLLNRGLSVVLVEKAPRFGGNSVKASSGINGVPTKFQHQRGINDSVESFIGDTLRSGKGLLKPALVAILAHKSQRAIEWLTELEFGNKVELSAVAQLGGHSNPRTHRGSGKLPPGFAIISALQKNIQALQKSPGAARLQVLTDATLTKLLTDKTNHVVGIEYTSEKGLQQLYSQNVVLATGGYSADFNGSGSLLARYRPDLLGYPLTNGVQTTGDGQKIAHRDVKARYIHMDQVQVHPTGFIKLGVDTTNAKFKFLCGEVVRGIGGVLLSPQGKRFVNELETRDVVTAAIEKECDIPFNTLSIPLKRKVAIVVLNHDDYLKAPSHIDFYVSQGLMFKSTLAGLQKALKELNPQLLEAHLLLTFQEYNEAASGTGVDIYGRKTFGNLFTLSEETPIYYGLITPVVHFSMGGLEINENAEVINTSGNVVENLYAIGEVSGGVHGHNRLGGNSLLECVVFGSVCAEAIHRKF